MRLTCSQIASYTSARELAAPADAKLIVEGITWDSREVTPGCLYVALPGERVDGHSFVPSAVEAGAACVLVSHKLEVSAMEAARAAGAGVLLVEDTAASLVDLARGWREHLNGQVLAITGSVGKTTTKNLVRDVLATTYAVSATKANQNNELGVPRTVLDAAETDEYVVVEMGMRGAGQLCELCEFVKPTMALITNAGESHIELLGSRENIARAKAEVLEGLPEGGRAFLNAADAFCESMRSWTNVDERGVSVVLFNGSGAAAQGGNQVWASHIVVGAQGNPAFTLHATLEGQQPVEMPVELGLIGTHNVANAMAAAAVGLAAGVAPEHVARALAAAQPESGRGQFATNEAGIVVINDAYNANPASTCAALDTLARMQVAGRRFAVLGDMGELGNYAEEGHLKVGSAVAQAGVDFLITIGPLAQGIATQAKAEGLPEEAVLQLGTRENLEAARAEALAYLQEHLHEGDAVLVKASHSVGLEEVAKGLLG